MIRILTLVNTGVLIGLIGGGAFVFSQRTKVVNNMLFTIQDQIIENIQSQIPKMPGKTGPALPFK
tara:strand:+ start:314 stop:508 length:195 start_codon:yes stop_codon:yes gene_type:complete